MHRNCLSAFETAIWIFYNNPLFVHESSYSIFYHLFLFCFGLIMGLLLIYMVTEWHLNGQVQAIWLTSFGDSGLGTQLRHTYMDI